MIDRYEQGLVSRKSKLDIIEANPQLKDEKGETIWQITLNGKQYDRRSAAFDVLKSMMTSGITQNAKIIKLGSYRGFELTGHISRQELSIEIDRLYSVAYSTSVYYKE